MKWGISSRTFSRGDRIIKIQSNHSNEEPAQTLQHQYQILRKIQTDDSGANPRYADLGQNWTALEMDTYSGVLISPKLISNKLLSIPICQIIKKSFHLSLKGVFYKQLRPRHMVWDENLKELNLIDFGGV